MTTHYQPTQQGGMSFTSTRRPGEVRIPNYVYDIWMPLLGIEAIGVYAVYCRLEREGTVKAMSQQRIAQEMRIGVGKLNKTNDLLKRYGFIGIRQPESYEKLMHYTTEITVHDPPRTASAATIRELKHPQGYETLCPWLTETEPQPIGNAEDTNEPCANQSGGNANVAPPVFAPSVFAEEGGATAPHAPADESWPTEPAVQEPEPPRENPAEKRLARMRAVFGDDLVSVGAHCQEAQEKEGTWTVPVHRGLSPACAVVKEATGYSPDKVLRPDIDQAIPADPDSLERWYKVCHAWRLCGYSYKNIGGMLDCYAEGRIPNTKPGGKRNGGRGTGGQPQPSVIEFQEPDFLTA